MLDLSQIQSFFPENQRGFARNVLREYLQYKILDAVFAARQGPELVFLGGTAIHIVHGNSRFSEDLDFDNRGLSMDEFKALATGVRNTLEREGYTIELKFRGRGAYRADFRFIGLLQKMGITGHREEKLMIHFDSEPQDFNYTPERIILNRFDVFSAIHVVPVDILLAQKIACILQRPRPVGRDIYDTVFLFGKTGPNAEYLAQKCDIHSEKQLWMTLKIRCDALDFDKLGLDLKPFLIHADEVRKVSLFPDFVASKQAGR